MSISGHDQKLGSGMGTSEKPWARREPERERNAVFAPQGGTDLRAVHGGEHELDLLRQAGRVGAEQLQQRHQEDPVPGAPRPPQV
eukprot:CAMPEP_0171963292 /NCGR_PEP_ID=MMETSP0993-20121228/174615_1 /TAXON_ID=483369 /ORGANISM="non described non described, Strain CCMP2098" /LENGTH=84 /DNA_ID=CAMNT_0012611829 /DNA_START=38 /DNA_END=288 /DNA_ORIENTATION=-